MNWDKNKTQIKQSKQIDNLFINKWGLHTQKQHKRTNKTFDIKKEVNSCFIKKNVIWVI